MSKSDVYFASLGSCNENCLFCVKRGDEEKVKDLDTKESKEKIYQYAKGGWEHLIFDGGEPTLRDDLPELISYAYEEGFEEVTILTNALKLSDKSFVQKILKAPAQVGVDPSQLSFSVSLHSHKREISEMLVGKEGSFKKTLKGLENILICGGRASVYHIITKYNYEDLPEFVDFLYRNYPSLGNICFSFIYPAGAALKNQYIFPKLSEAEPYVYNAFEKTENYGWEFSLATCGIVPLCFLKGFERYTVNQQRRETPDNIKVVDSEKEEGYQLASDEFHNKTKVKPPRCEKCILNELCTGLWDFYADMYGVEELEPVVDRSSFKEVFLAGPVQEEVKKAKDDLRGFEGIFFVDYEIKKFRKEEVAIIIDFIRWLADQELNYLITKPLPPRNRQDIDLFEELGVPVRCEDCLDLYRVEGGEVYFCNGAKCESCNEHSSKVQILKEFRESRPQPRSDFFKSCWFRKIKS